LAFAEAGLHWHWDENLYGDLLAVAGGKQRIAHFIACYQPEMPATTDLLTFIKELQAIKNRHYAQLLKTGKIPPRLGVIRLINEAKSAGLRLAIATTTMAENVEALFATAFSQEMLSWFEVIATDESVTQKKPAPDVYQYVIEKMQLSAQECLAIEDSQQGLQAALSAKISTLITVNGYTQQQDFSGALAVVNHLGELEKPLTCLTQSSLEPCERVNVAVLNKLLNTNFRV
jgi:HAD superfamily hydrolase (TIGR01509 family)